MDYEQKLIYSGILILATIVLKELLILFVRKRPGDDEGRQRRWINSLRNIFNLGIVLGLLVLWLSELRFFALSIAAFVVAIVIATREFIQCFLGSLYLASSRAFSVGDWIHIDDIYGEVVSRDWLSTSLLEVDMKNKTYAFTGRTMNVPNNRFITSSVANLNFMRRYVEHTFTLVREPDAMNLSELKSYTIKKAREHCAEFQEIAERYNTLIENRLGVKIPMATPRVKLTTTEIGKNAFVITIFCPTNRAAQIEQAIVQDFMSKWQELKQEAAKT